MNASARRELAARGLNTESFGLWLGRQRILVRTIIAVLAVLWLFALRPLSVGDIVLVAFVAFGVAWILELLQRRPDELAAVARADEDDAARTATSPSRSTPTGREPARAEILTSPDESPTLDLTRRAAAGCRDRDDGRGIRIPEGEVG